MIKDDNEILNGESRPTDDGDKHQCDESPTKVQDLAKAGREDFDPNEGQE